MSEAPTTEAPAATPAEAPAPSLADSLYPNGVADGQEVNPPSEASEPTPASREGANSEDADTQTAPAPVSEPAPTPGPDSTTAPNAIDPASYELSFPDGFTVQDDILTEARSALADAGVPKEKAQSLANVFVKALESAAQAQASTIEAQQSAWLTEINAMPEFQGQTREKSLQQIGALVDQHPGLKEALTNPLIGNNPAMARFMLKVASTLAEGTSTPTGGVPDGANRRGSRSLGERLFPDGIKDSEVANARN